MASLERTAGGWRVVWRLGGRGSPRRKSEVFPKERLAKEAKARIEAQLAAGRPIGPGSAPLTLPVLIERYRLHHADLTQDHLDKLDATLTKLAKEKSWSVVADIRPADLAGLRVHQSRHLRALLRFALDQDQPVDQRVFRTAKPKAPRRRPSTLLTDERVQALVAKATESHPAHGALIHLVATYGHRCESIIRIRVRDLDLVAGQLTLPVKSGDIHRHPITKATRAILQPFTLNPDGTARAGDEVLLLTDGTKPWTNGTEVSGWWLKNIAAKGEGILDLRRYAITRMLALGLDARTVASITGHRTVSLLLNTYSRTSDARQTAAMEAMEKSGDTTVSGK